MSSLDSVPDEYTVFNKEPSNNSQSQVDISNRQSKGVEQSNRKYKPDIHEYSRQKQNHLSSKYQNENIETEIENEETQSSGLEPKYSLNVPSMITHLKRKDHYLESLDTFLNENLKAISDLIKIK